MTQNSAVRLRREAAEEDDEALALLEAARLLQRCVVRRALLCQPAAKSDAQLHALDAHSQGGGWWCNWARHPAVTSARKGMWKKRR